MCTQSGSLQKQSVIPLTTYLYIRYCFSLLSVLFFFFVIIYLAVAIEPGPGNLDLSKEPGASTLALDFCLKSQGPYNTQQELMELFIHLLIHPSTRPHNYYVKLTSVFEQLLKGE